MSRARHKMRASGGSVVHKYNAEGSPAMERAEERKKGGRVKAKHHMHGEGEHTKMRHDRKARGGSMMYAKGGHVKHHAHGGAMHHDDAAEDKEMIEHMVKPGALKKRARGGHVSHHVAHGGHVMHEHHGKVAHHHTRGRKRGGGIGSDKMPLTSAAKVKHVTPGETPEEGWPDGGA